MFLFLPTVGSVFANCWQEVVAFYSSVVEQKISLIKEIWLFL
jgi:hypothetical protein